MTVWANFAEARASPKSDILAVKSSSSRIFALEKKFKFEGRKLFLPTRSSRFLEVYVYICAHIYICNIYCIYTYIHICNIYYNVCHFIDAA